MSASDYAEAKLLDHLLGTTAYTKPTSVYIKLHTGAAGENGTAALAAQTARKLVTFGATTVGTGVAVSNSAATWTGLTAAETFAGFSVWDTIGPTGGNCLADGTISPGVAVVSGNTFTIASGSITVTAT